MQRSFGIVSNLSVLGSPCPDCPHVKSIHRKWEAATRDRKVEFSIKLLIKAERAAQDAAKKEYKLLQQTVTAAWPFLGRPFTRR